MVELGKKMNDQIRGGMKYTIIMIGGIKSSGKSRLYEELNSILGRSKYDKKLILIEEDLISYYDNDKYVCPEDIIKSLANQANCIILGNQHHQYSTTSLFIKDNYDAWRKKMQHRLNNGRVNSKSASVKDSELLKMTRTEFENYYNEKKSKVGSPKEMDFNSIKKLVLETFK